MEGIQLRKVSGKVIASPVNHEGVIGKLPVAIYTTSVDDKGNIYYNEVATRYTLPALIMGDTNSYKTAILEAFTEETTESTGVIMTGLAGSGKSMLAELLSNEMMDKHNMPVIVIDKKLPNDLIKDIMRIAGDCVVYFDELGKYYDYQDQGKLLTVFSDSEFKNNLYIVCDNDKVTLHRFFFDRPGRFLFHLDFKGLSRELVDEYLNTMKVDGVLREYIESFVHHHRAKVSFDILRTLVKFSKKFKDVDQYVDFIKMINVPHPPITVYKMVSLTKGEDVYADTQYSLTHNRLTGEFTLINYKDKVTVKFMLTDDGVKKEQDGNGDYTYMINMEGYDIILSSSKAAPSSNRQLTDQSEQIRGKDDPYNRRPTLHRYERFERDDDSYEL